MNAKAFFSLSLLLSVFALGIFASQRLQFDRQIERMFAANSVQLDNYRKTSSIFGSSDAVLVSVATPDLFVPGKGQVELETIVALDQELSSISGVEEVVSLADIMDAFSIGPVRLWKEPADFPKETLELFANLTHSQDGKVAAIACLLKDKNSSKEDVSYGDTVAAIEAIAARFSTPDRPVHVIGEPVLVEKGFQLVERDGWVLTSVATVSMTLILLGLFRDIRWIGLTFLVLGAAIFGTFLLVWLLGLRLTMVSSMFGSVVTIVGVAAISHWIVATQSSHASPNSVGSAQIGFQKILFPLFLACLTDALGFATLLYSKVGPVRDYGIMTSLGCIAVFIAIWISVPVANLWLTRNPLQSEPGILSQRLFRFDFALRHPTFIILSFCVLATALTPGLFMAKVESEFTRNFQTDTPIAKSYAYVEEKLGGAGVWDVVIKLPGKLDWNRLEHIKEFQRELSETTSYKIESSEERPGLTKVLSIADMFERLLPVSAENAPIMVRDPLINSVMKVLNSRFPQMTHTLVVDDKEPGFTYVRVMLRSREQLPAEHRRFIIEKVTSACERFESRHPGTEVYASGTFILLAELVNNVLADQWIMFGLAIAAMLVSLVAAFRNFKLAIAAIIPNVFPFLAVLGAMGWLDIHVNLGSALIAAISVGLSIDSSIHFVVAYLNFRRSGLSIDEALQLTQTSAGRAATYATLVLAAGFLTLAFSDFLPTVFFGVLVSLTMVAGLLGNLALLPAFIKLMRL